MNEGFELTLDMALEYIAELENKIRDLEADNKMLRTKYEKPLTWNRPDYYIANGTRKGAFEVYFDGMPGTGYIEQLKKLKMRWNKTKKCWYGFVLRSEIEYALMTEEEAEAVA